MEVRVFFSIYDLRFTMCEVPRHGTTLRDFVACVGLSTKLLPLTGLLKESLKSYVSTVSTPQSIRQTLSNGNLLLLQT